MLAEHPNVYAILIMHHIRQFQFGFWVAVASLAVALVFPSFAAPTAPCCIQVVEKGSGWPVPLVELRTTHLARFITDNAGVIAFDLPELMGHETWFDVLGNGYEVPKDGFGYRPSRARR
jgi:hypothetical protein